MTGSSFARLLSRTFVYFLRRPAAWVSQSSMATSVGTVRQMALFQISLTFALTSNMWIVSNPAPIVLISISALWQFVVMAPELSGLRGAGASYAPSIAPTFHLFLVDPILELVYIQSRLAKFVFYTDEI